MPKPLLHLVVVLMILLTACGGEDTVVGDEDTVVGDEDAAVGEEGDDDFRIAILTPGSVEDRGYNADAQRAAELVEQDVNGVSEVSLTQSVDVADQADVYRQFASQGYDLVIGWGGQFTEGALEVASEFAETQFLVINSFGANDANVASMDTDIEQWQFLAGFVLGRLTETGKVGVIGSICFPATAANVHGSEQGARHANPDVEIVTIWTGDFEDPTNASQAAEAMIDEGVDAITGNMNNAWFGVFEAAKEGGEVPVVTEWVDNHELAPEVIASSVLKSQDRFVVELVQLAQAGSLGGEHYQFSLPEDWGPAISNTDLLPDDIYEEALTVQEQISNGEVEVEHDESCPE